MISWDTGSVADYTDVWLNDLLTDREYTAREEL